MNFIGIIQGITAIALILLGYAIVGGMS